MTQPANEDNAPAVSEYTDDKGNTWQLTEEDAKARGLTKGGEKPAPATADTKVVRPTSK